MSLTRKPENVSNEETALLKKIAVLVGQSNLYGSISIHYAGGEPKTIEVKYQRPVRVNHGGAN